MNAIFITGTDTGVGKTYISTALLRQFNATGYTTFGIKPIATGCKKNDAGNLVNDDALALMAASSVTKDYNIVNPLAFPEPIAPHLAAAQSGIKLSTKQLAQTIVSSIQTTADINIIEGVGGWSVPLNDHDLISDAICLLKIPVVLVVAIKLGCLNHAILTSKNITQSNVPFIGWIANCVEANTLVPSENILTLEKWLAVPCLGIMPYQSRKIM